MEVSQKDVVNAVGFKSDGDQEPITHLNDALVCGTIDPAISSRQLTLAFGRSRKDTQWKNVPGTVGQLLGNITKFERGAKDGRCLLQGALVDGALQRVAKSMAAQHLILLDVDVGMSMEEVVDLVTRHDLFAVLWTTHSHLKPETEIAEQQLQGWMRKAGHTGAPTTAHAVEYLRTVKHIRPEILEGADLGARKQVPDVGFVYPVRHQPLPRLRVLLLLERPFVFSERAGTQQDALQEWSERYAGTAAMLGLPVDKSCADAARLMYTPRIPATAKIGEGTAEIVVLAGKMLDLDTVARVLPHTAAAQDDPSAAFTGRGGREFKTPNMGKFLATAGHDFEAADWAQSIGIEPRHQHADGMDCECPNAASHTNQDVKDRAFSIRNASGNATGTGFAAWCLHEGCKAASGGDRAWYLDQLCVTAGVKDAMELISPEWTPNVWAERQAEYQKRGKAADENGRQKLEDDIASLERGQLQEAGRLCERLGALLLDPVASEILLDKIVDAIKPEGAGVRATDKVRNPLKAVYRESRKKAEDARKAETTDRVDPAEMRAASARLTARFKWVLEAGAFYDVVTRTVRPRQVIFDEIYEDLPITQNSKRVDPRSVVLTNTDSKFERMAYRPDKGEVFVENGLRCLNTYRPSRLRPVAGDPSPILEHIGYLFGCDLQAETEEDYWRNYRTEECAHFLDVLAYKVQHPEAKIMHAICIGSKPGVGKGTVARCIKPIFGADNVVEPDNQEIIKGRMGFVESRLCAVIHELHVGLDRRDVVARMKPVITEPTIRIERKYMNEYEVDSIALLLAFTNYPDDVHIEPEDRRWWLFKSPSKSLPAGEVRARHFDPLHRWIDGDGPAIFYRWLLDRDVSKFDPNELAPMTVEKAANMEASKGEVQTRLEELFADQEAPFDRDLINLPEALGKLRDDHRLKVSLAKLTTFLRDKGARPLGADGSVKYRLPGSGKIYKKRLWAIRDADAWLGAPAEQVGEAVATDHHSFMRD